MNEHDPLKPVWSMVAQDSDHAMAILAQLREVEGEVTIRNGRAYLPDSTVLILTPPSQQPTRINAINQPYTRAGLLSKNTTTTIEYGEAVGGYIVARERGDGLLHFADQAALEEWVNNPNPSNPNYRPNIHAEYVHISEAADFVRRQGRSCRAHERRALR